MCELSLVAASFGYSIAAVSRLLIAVTSLVKALGCTRSTAVAYGLSYPTACGIFLDQGLNLCPQHW